MEKNGFVLWLTGFSGSGKTTIAKRVEAKLQKEGAAQIQLLDGDILREGMNKHLGFSKQDRLIQIEQATFIAKLLIGHGVGVIASFITPYQEMREHCRLQLGDNYAEVYVKCPIEECIKRDVKGLYKKALSGDISHFTGISDPFEEPTLPELTIETHVMTPDQSAEQVVQFLQQKGWL